MSYYGEDIIYGCNSTSNLPAWCQWCDQASKWVSLVGILGMSLLHVLSFLLYRFIIVIGRVCGDSGSSMRRSVSVVSRAEGLVLCEAALHGILVDVYGGR